MDVIFVICGDGRIICMVCKEVVGICFGEFGIIVIRWGGLICGGLYWEVGILFFINSIVVYNWK